MICFGYHTEEYSEAVAQVAARTVGTAVHTEALAVLAELVGTADVAEDTGNLAADGSEHTLAADWVQMMQH